MPALQTKVYGAVPPEICTSAVPSADPLQRAFVDDIVAVNKDGSVIEKLTVFEQPFASVTMTWYDPAINELTLFEE
jgi:hypothetical protein